ncbi:hypothetical protein [Aureimonas glaciei]|uniref:Uncharacterized protein n=1 Tax=Aureimonas glaciei TaxID=1776957 RepID=A0A916XYI9_9HYPH|nr:hypothetical protein [Aureimonas glaciei]GGD21808.1 hypothetical protein GCM10011335_25950 [Aureimonas glaciei]
MYSAKLLFVFCAILSMPPLSMAKADSVDLMVGERNGQNVTFSFQRDKNRKPVELVVTTRRLGNPGAKISIWIDRSSIPLHSRILTTDDCEYSDSGSSCRFSFGRDSDHFRKFLYAFERGKTAHVEVQNANVMEMQRDVSLLGFRQRYGR